MAYSTAEKLEILNYAKEHSLDMAAQIYHVSKPAIILWNKEYNIYPIREKRTFSQEEKVYILQQVHKNGLSEVARKFNIAAQTLYRWNTTLKVYKDLQMPEQKRRPHFTPAQKREILMYVREHGLCNAMRKYDLASSIIYTWNNTYQIFEKRPIRRFTAKQKKEILRLAQETSVSQAAYKFNVSAGLIRQWQEKQSKLSR